MEKTGEVKVGRTPCSLCERISKHSRGKQVLCTKHASDAKSASVDRKLKSFTNPIEE